MKVETPQILWNSEGDKGKNAPLYSVTMLESGVCDNDESSSNKFGNVLATAGNTNVINLWNVNFVASANNGRDGSICNSTTITTTSVFEKQQHKCSSSSTTKIDYLLGLTRHELPVNCVSFSPDGLHLVSAGEAGNIVIWSVPVSKRGNGNGRHFWSSVTKDSDLFVRIVSTHCEGVCDISWSADSKRFVVGTIDSNVVVYEDKHFQYNQSNPDTHQKESEWHVAFRSMNDHTHFVQGVSYDPLGAYVASMGSDRTVRVFPRKTPPKSKKKVLRPSNAKGIIPPPDHQRMVNQLLTDTKLEFGKSKQLKHRRITVDANTGAQIKLKMFADESTCESFFRRLTWTTDGAFLVTPAAIWHSDVTVDKDASSTNARTVTSNSTTPSFSTYLFARHRYDEPYMVLSGLEKPSVVVRPNPVLFQLPKAALRESKENQSPEFEKQTKDSHSSDGLPYRSIFAVLTLDSVLIYDTYHTRPLSIARGLHYAGLTDCTWSKDGLNLIVSSSDGYISILSFRPGELGEVYTTPSTEDLRSGTKHDIIHISPSECAPIPPCEPGQEATLQAPPSKRAKKTRIAPVLVSTPPLVPSPQTQTSSSKSSKRSIQMETDTVGAAVTKLSLSSSSTEEKPKKKKRIQPVLIST